MAALAAHGQSRNLEPKPGSLAAGDRGLTPLLRHGPRRHQHRAALPCAPQIAEPQAVNMKRYSISFKIAQGNTRVATEVRTSNIV